MVRLFDAIYTRKLSRDRSSKYRCPASRSFVSPFGKLVPEKIIHWLLIPAESLKCCLGLD
jgi:hypothetical protein